MRSILPPSDAPAPLFDGESARPRVVQAWLAADALVVADDAGEERIARGLLTREADAGRITLYRSDAPDWRLASRVMPRQPVEAVAVRVGRSDGVNAFTLPGGQIVILSGLIDAAKSPDEVAGVLAHELGHVQKRHPNQALIRHFGFDVFAQGLGGNVGSLAATGLFLRNSRAAEREADGEALDLLRDGGVSPVGLADFFRRLEGDAKRHDGSRLEQLASLAATHPSDGSRQARFRVPAGRYPATPALAAADWQALRRICRRG